MLPRPSAPPSFPDFSLHRWLATEAPRHTGAASATPETLCPPHEIATNEILRQEAIRYSVQLLVAERCSLAATAGLINATAAEAHKRFLASQALDEARHMEVFTYRLLALGVEPGDLEATVVRYAHPDLVGLSELVLRPVEQGDFLGGLLAQGLILDEIVAETYRLLAVLVGTLEPGFAGVIKEAICDEERHGSFAESVVAELLPRHPDRKLGLDRLQREMTALMLSTFADAFRDNPMADELRRVLVARNHGPSLDWQGIDPLVAAPGRAEAVLERVIATRVRARFARLGITYHSTSRP